MKLGSDWVYIGVGVAAIYAVYWVTTKGDQITNAIPSVINQTQNKTPIPTGNGWLDFVTGLDSQIPGTPLWGVRTTLDIAKSSWFQNAENTVANWYSGVASYLGFNPALHTTTPTIAPFTPNVPIYEHTDTPVQQDWTNFRNLLFG